jgi:hypothetical protein
MEDNKLFTKTNKIYESSHNMEGEYAVLMETNGHECESWYYFIRKQGNEEALKNLQEQLEKVDWYILDDLSTFDLDLENFVSAKTAKEMSKIEINSYMFHRKFDGKLKTIDLGFRSKDKNKKKIEKTFDLLGYGQIEDYISDEDIDPEDLLSGTESERSDSSNESYSDSSSESSSDSESESDDKKKKIQRIPSSLTK